MSAFRRRPDSRRAAHCFRCSRSSLSDNSARHTFIVGPHLRPSGTRGAPLSPGWRNRWNDRPGWPTASHCRLVPWRTDSFVSSVRPTPAERCWCPNRRLRASTLVAYAIFSRSGNPTNYIRAPAVKDRNRSDDFSSSVHCPRVAYSSN